QDGDEDLALAKARVVLAVGAEAGAGVGAVTDPRATGAVQAVALRRLADRAAALGRRPAAWRAALAAARLHERDDDHARAADALALSRSIFEEVRMATHEQYRTGLEADPEARWLSRPAGGGDTGAHDAGL